MNTFEMSQKSVFKWDGFFGELHMGCVGRDVVEGAEVGGQDQPRACQQHQRTQHEHLCLVLHPKTKAWLKIVVSDLYSVPSQSKLEKV